MPIGKVFGFVSIAVALEKSIQRTQLLIDDQLHLIAQRE